MLLLLFVCGSLAFSAWAWKSYDLHGFQKTCQEPSEPIDKTEIAIRTAAVALYAGLLESFTRYTDWPYVIRLMVAAAAAALIQTLALKALGSVRQAS